MWHDGNGDSIKSQKQTLLPDCRPLLERAQKVSNLMDQGKGKWNEDMVQQVYHPRVSNDSILSLPWRPLTG